MNEKEINRLIKILSNKDVQESIDSALRIYEENKNRKEDL